MWAAYKAHKQLIYNSSVIAVITDRERIQQQNTGCCFLRCQSKSCTATEVEKDVSNYITGALRRNQQRENSLVCVSSAAVSLVLVSERLVQNKYFWWGQGWELWLNVEQVLQGRVLILNEHWRWTWTHSGGSSCLYGSFISLIISWIIHIAQNS